MDVLGGLFFCGVALVPLAALVFLFNLWQRVQRLEATVRTLAAGGAVAVTDAVAAAPPAIAPPMAGTTTLPVSVATTPSISPAAPATVSTPTASTTSSPAPAIAPATAAPTASTAPLAPPRRERGGVERTLGARLPIWIGSIAVALAGIFLFKYAIDEGYFGPTARVTVGVIAGLVLLAVAEWLRRRSRSVAGGIAAAGIAVLYASIVAATNLYGLLGPLAGGAAMAAVTAAAVALSLRFGPVVVVVGLVGGFLTPALIGDVEPNPWRLFSYLALLQLGVLAVARKRAWWWLGPVVLLGGGIWSILWLVDGSYDPVDGLPLGLFILFGAAAIIGAAEAGRSRDPEARGVAADASGALGGSAVDVVPATRRFDPSIAAGWMGIAYAGALLALTVTAGNYRLFDWLFYAILGIGVLVLGRLKAEWDRLPWLTAALTAGLLVNAADALRGGATALPWWLAPAFGVLYAVGAYGLMLRSAHPDRWAILSAASTVVFFHVSRAALWPDEPTDRWGLVAAGLAVALAIGAAPLARRRLAAGHGAADLGASEAAGGGANGEAEARAAIGLAALCIGAVTLLFFGAAIDLEQWWLAAAWAAIAAGACWAARRLRLPALAHTAWPLAGLATLRLLAIPDLAGFPAGGVPVFNPILLGYAGPIAAFLVAAKGASFLRRSDDDEGVLAEALRWMALLLTVAMAHILISHAFHRSAGAGLWDPGDGRWALTEWAVHALAPLGLALAVRTLARRWPWRALRLGGMVLTWGALAAVAVIALLAANPLLRALPVGRTPVLNALLLLYGAPAALCLVLARRQLADGDATPLPAAAGALAGVLGFALLSLEIRQAFHGSVLTGGETTPLEQYSYSLAWVLFGLGLLALGIARKLPAARYASLAVMIVTVCKVFLIDTAGLTGLYRVFSFLGLGLSLLGLAFLYQRFVFNMGASEEA